MTAHVLAPGEDQRPTGHGHANGSNHAAMVAALAEQLRCATHEEREHRYTLHLDFAAGSGTTARKLAVALAEGLSTLCPNVQAYSAALSTGGSWDDAEAVFCMAGGPFPCEQAKWAAAVREIYQHAGLIHNGHLPGRSTAPGVGGPDEEVTTP